MGLFKIILPMLVVSAFAHAGSLQNLTYQGRIIKSDGTPLEYSHVAFSFSIVSPTGLCVLYSETVSGIDMTNSGGVFDVPIGSGTRSYPTSGTFSIMDAFDNANPLTCQGGASYHPTAYDGRFLRVQFHDGNGWKVVSPDTEIRSVPYAGYSLSAAMLGSHTADEFVQKAEINSGAACDGGSFLTWDPLAGSFGCSAVSGASGGTVTNVTASSPLSVTNGTSTPNITIQVANGSQNGYLSSSDWTTFNNKLGASSTLSGDVSGTPSTTSVDKLKGTPLSISSLSSNQVLKYSGGNWINSTLATSDISGLDTTLSGISTTLSSAVMQSQFPASCAANQTLTFVSPSGSFSCSSIAINGSQVSGNISGNAAGFTGSLAGDVSGTQGATSVDKIKGVAVSATAPTSNQVLTYTGGSWTPADLPSGTLSGSGTAGYVPYYNTATTLANSSLYYNGSNVGIGTASPTSKLHVHGVIKITDTFSGVGKTIGANGSMLEIKNNDNGSMAFTNLTGFGFYFNQGAASRLTIDSAGDVNVSGSLGVGTVPQKKLHVRSDGAFQMRLQNGSSGGGFWNIGQADNVFGSGGGKLLFVPDSDDSTTAAVAFTNSGSVGIGTTSPTEKLEVAGNIKGTQLCIGADCRSSWPSGSGGTVTSVAAGTGLTGGTITTTGTLAVDVGTTANKIVQLDASGKLPAVDGSALTNLNLTNLNASNLTSGTVPAARMPALTGDVTSSAGSTATTLAQIQGKSVTISSLASGDYLKYNGTGWINDPLSSADLSDSSSLIKSSQMPANCAAGQTLTFSSPTGAWTCSNIVVTASNFGLQTQNTFLAAPNGSNGTPTFRTIASADLPSGTLSGSGTAGYIPYYNTASTLANSNIYNSGGNVGIGTTTPTTPLHVSSATSPAFRLEDGTQGMNKILTSDANGNATWQAIPATGAATSMISGWPDAIRCAYASTGDTVFLYPYAYGAAGTMQYQANYGAGYYMVTFTNSGGYSTNSNLYNGTASNCIGKSIAQLTANGQTWLYAGGGGNIWTQAGANVYWTGGNVGVGTTNPGAKLHIQGSDGAVGLLVENVDSSSSRYPYATVTNYRGATDTSGYPVYHLINNRGTKGSQLPVQNGDWLGAIQFWGADSTASGSANRGAQIIGVARETFTTSSGATDLAFFTSPSGAADSTNYERLRITSTGNVGIGTTAPTQALEVNGTVKATNFAGSLNGVKMAGGNFTFSSGSCNLVSSPCVIDISSAGFSTTPACTITMQVSDNTSYVEKMVIQNINSTQLKIWKGNNPDTGTTMRGYWTCIGG